MTSCVVGKKVGAVGSGHLELFPFVVLAICVLSLMAMAGGVLVSICSLHGLVKYKVEMLVWQFYKLTVHHHNLNFSLN